MRKRKTFKILVAMFLVLGVFNGSALAEACFCGSACFHARQPEGKIKGYLLFHMRCPCDLCKSCGLEKNQTLKAAGSVSRMLNVTSFNTAFILSDFLDDPSKHQILNNFDLYYACGTIPALPVYLQTLSILC
jgi:hypothetical protein